MTKLEMVGTFLTYGILCAALFATLWALPVINYALK